MVSKWEKMWKWLASYLLLSAGDWEHSPFQNLYKEKQNTREQEKPSSPVDQDGQSISALSKWVGPAPNKK